MVAGARPLHFFRKTEVSELDKHIVRDQVARIDTLWADEKILRLDVAVHVTVHVDVVQCCQTLEDYSLNFAISELFVPFLPLCNLLVQIALAVFEHNIDLAAAALPMEWLSWRVVLFVAAGVYQFLDFNQKRRSIQHLERLDFWLLQSRLGRGLRTF